MAKELPYFKFEPSEWMFGRIQKQPPNVVVAFINLCCKYWHELGCLELETVKLDFGEQEIELLIKHKIVMVHEGNISIKFLDRQFDEIDQFSKNQSVKGKLSAEKRAMLKATKGQPVLNSGSTSVQPSANQVQPIIGEDTTGDNKTGDETAKNDSKNQKADETKKTPSVNPIPPPKPVQSNLERFKETVTDQESAVKYLKGLNRALSIKRILQLAESFNIAHTEEHPVSNYENWKKYFRYFLNNHREPKMPENAKGEAYKPYNPRS
jgi:hypothetical protein